MDNPARMALAAGSGYLLGRRKKLALAVTVGSLITGKRVPSTGDLLAQGAQFLRGNPEFAQLRDKLMGAGRSAAIAAASNRMSRATERLALQADAISGKSKAPSGPADNEQADEPQEPNTADEPGTERRRSEDRPEALNGAAWRTLSETTQIARGLREQQDREQMKILLRDTDCWFAERLPPVPPVKNMADQLTGFAEWAGMRYRLLELLEDKSRHN